MNSFRYNECDDFFNLIVNSHIAVAAMKLLQMNTLEDTPNLPTGFDALELWMESIDKRKDVLLSVCGGML